ncbi:MAG: hypothetical protein ABWW70_03075 [Thermoproteota archaeon]
MNGYLGYSVVLARLANDRRLLPADAPKLRELLRRVVARPLTVHVAPRWIEAVIFSAPSPGEVERRLRGAGFRVLEVYSVEAEHKASGGDPVELLQRYSHMMASARFWEAHTVGEDVWHSCGPLGRLLAALAGAHAKAQEGLLEAARRIVARVREEAGGLRVADLVDWSCLLRTVELTYTGREANPLPCLEKLIERVTQSGCSSRPPQ